MHLVCKLHLQAVLRPPPVFSRAFGHGAGKGGAGRPWRTFGPRTGSVSLKGIRSASPSQAGPWKPKCSVFALFALLLSSAVPHTPPSSTMPRARHHGTTAAALQALLSVTAEDDASVCAYVCHPRTYAVPGRVSRTKNAIPRNAKRGVISFVLGTPWIAQRTGLYYCQCREPKTEIRFLGLLIQFYPTETVFVFSGFFLVSVCFTKTATETGRLFGKKTKNRPRHFTFAKYNTDYCLS